MDKVEMYGWVIEDKPGKFMMIGKRLLNIDHDYQRDHIRHNRVNAIAAVWSWARLLVLGVARRPDGTYWVFDGQHRKLAADKRSDIEELPCMVFNSTGPVDEAKLFLDIQRNRSSLQIIDSFKALLARKDETAEQVDRMVRADGYKIARGGMKFTVQCVGVIYRSVAADQDAARVAWTACVEMFAGEPVIDRVFAGLFTVERHLARLGLGSLADGRWRPFVRQLTPKSIARSIAVAVEFHGKGGAKAQGEGVIRLLNKRKRTNTIPSLYAEAEEHVEAAD